MTTVAQLARLEADLGELIARRARAGRDRRNFARYADDPVGFVRRVLGADPWARQVEIAEAVRDRPFVAVRSANSMGKDWLAARLALWWVYARGGLVLLTGPTERQVVEILMRKEIAAAFRAGNLPGDLGTKALRLPGGRLGILAMTSTEAGRLTGFHGERVMAVLTEAQDLEDLSFEAVTACAVDPDTDRVLALGNPLHPAGRFWVISQPSSQWVKMRIPAREHPNVVAGRKVIPGGPTRAWVESQRREWGADSPIYAARVEAEFPEVSEDALLTRGWVEAAVERHERGALADRARASAWRGGLDVAAGGADSTVLALRRGPVLAELLTWRLADTMQTTARVGAALRDRRFAPRAETNPMLAPTAPEFGPGIAQPDVTVAVDVIGVGKGVHDRLAELGWGAEPFHASASARDARRERESRYANARAEAYWHLRELFEAGEIAIPRDEALIEELLATRYKTPDSSGKIFIEPKDDIKRRLGRSPDRADAVALAFRDSGASGGGAVIDL